MSSHPERPKKSFTQRFKTHVHRKRGEGFWSTSVNLGVLPFNVPVWLLLLACIAIAGVLVYFLKYKIQGDKRRKAEWLKEISLSNPGGAPFPVTNVAMNVQG